YDNSIGIFSNYSDKPLNMDIVYAGNFDMKINNFLSTQLSLNLVYYEDQINKAQFKQTLGVGLTYKISNQTPPEQRRKRRRKKADRIVYPHDIKMENIKFKRTYYDRNKYDSVFIKKTVTESNIKSETIFNQ